jgi:folate-dependent tRNA-U54 methylase TrmFO/GidA
MKANFGIMPALAEPIRNKRARYEAYVIRALADLETTIAATNLVVDQVDPVING